MVNGVSAMAVVTNGKTVMGMFNGERYEMLYPDTHDRYGDNQGTCDYTFRCMNEQDAYLLDEWLSRGANRICSLSSRASIKPKC